MRFYVIRICRPNGEQFTISHDLARYQAIVMLREWHAFQPEAMLTAADNSRGTLEFELPSGFTAVIRSF